MTVTLELNDTQASLVLDILKAAYYGDKTSTLTEAGRENLAVALDQLKEQV